MSSNPSRWCLASRRSALVRAFARNRRGNVGVIFGLVMLPVMTLVGAGVDYGRVIAEKGRLQGAIDAAVLAGAAASTSKSAVAQATLNGALGAQTSIVTASGFTPNNDGSLSGSVTVAFPLSMLQVVGLSSESISAHATVIPTTVTGASTTKVCILLKDPSASQSLLVNSNVTISAPNCEIDVASTGSPAAMINNGSGINVAKLCVASSSVTTNGTAPASLAKSCTVAADPFAGTLPTPSSSTCTVSNQNYSGTTALSPGVYCGNFNFNGSGTLNLAAGVYVFKNTRWNLNSGWNVSGTGVTIYFADANSYIQVNSGVNISIAAPTTGTYANILMYEPTGLSTSSFSINGSAGHSFTGLIYLPSRNVTFNSVSTLSSESITMVFNQMILDTINWTFSGAPLSISSGGGSAVSTVRLVN